MSDYVTELASILGSHVWFGPLLTWPLLGGCAGFVATVLLCGPRSRRAPSPELHWSVRARWAHECRTARVRATVVAVMTMGFCSFSATQPLGLLASTVSVLSMAATAAGVMSAFRMLFPALIHAKTRRERLDDLAFGPGTLFYWALTPVVFLPFVTTAFDAQTVIVMTLAVAFHFAWGYSALPLWRSLGLVTSPTPEVEALARRAAEHTQTPLRRVSVWRWSVANAFALPLSSEVAIAERLIQILTLEELRGVVLHELAHLREPRRMIMARLCLALAPLGLVLLPPLVGVHGFLGAVALFVGMIAFTLACSRVVKGAEHAADAGAHGEDTSPAYASALEKLHEDRLLPAVMGKKGQSHPDLYDRMLAAGVTPDFPRPAAPETSQGFGYFVGLVVFFTLGMFSASWVKDSVRHSEYVSAATWLVTPSADDLLRLELQNDSEQARALVALGLRTSVDPDAWFDHAWEMHRVRDCEGVAALANRTERMGAHDERFWELSVSLQDLTNRCWE